MPYLNGLLRPIVTGKLDFAYLVSASWLAEIYVTFVFRRVGMWRGGLGGAYP